MNFGMEKTVTPGDTCPEFLDRAYVSASHLWVAPNFQCEFQNDFWQRKPTF